MSIIEESKKNFPFIPDALLSFGLIHQLIALGLLEHHKVITAFDIREVCEGWVVGDSYVYFIDAIYEIMYYFSKFKKDFHDKIDMQKMSNKLIKRIIQYLHKYEIKLYDL